MMTKMPTIPGRQSEWPVYATLKEAETAIDNAVKELFPVKYAAQKAKEARDAAAKLPDPYGLV
jgi:hypothetical protein